MNCPVCTEERLVMSDRAGVEIDYCPKCRGVWLDRGELDKIIERATVELAQVPVAATPPSPPTQHYPVQPPRQAGHPAPPPAPYGYDDDWDDRYGKKKYKKKSILGEIFDF
jgi:uncharacterized protein